MKNEKYPVKYLMTIGAKAKTDIRKLSESLSAAKQYKASLKDCLIINSDEKERSFQVEMRPDSISMMMLSSGQEENPKKQMLLKLLELLSFCGWCYEITLSELYPHLAESLISNQLAYYSKKMKEMSLNEYSDILLAKRIIELKSRNAVLEESAASIQNKLCRAAPEIIISRFSSGSTIQEIMGYTGLNREEVNAALSELPNLGYRVIPGKNNCINVVRA